MNGLCSACGQPVEVVDFRLDEGRVLVRCPACGKEQRLSLSDASGAEAGARPAGADVPPATQNAPSPPLTVGFAAPASPAQAIEPAFDPPPGFCPKCIAPRTSTATTCPACGLLFANYQPAEVQPSAALAAAWRELAAAWDEGAAHFKFLRLAAASEELAAAGRLYRIRLAQSPADALARGGVEATVKAASVAVSVRTIHREATLDAPKSRTRKLVVMGLVLLGPLLLGLVASRFLGGH